MDMKGIRQEVLDINMSTREKAGAFLLETTAFEMDEMEWRELIAGVPADVITQIALLKSTGTQCRYSVSL